MKNKIATSKELVILHQTTVKLLTKHFTYSPYALSTKKG